MALKSKKFRTPAQGRSSEERFEELFTDREEPLAVFREALRSIPLDDQMLLVFYGIGGQGKSWLCRKLRDVLAKDAEEASTPPALWGHLDFRDAERRGAARGLLELRRSLARSGSIRFLAFDTAITRYWELAYHEVDFQGANRDLFDSSEDILAEVTETTVNNLGEVPAGIGLGVRALNYVRRRFTDYWSKKQPWAAGSIEALRGFDTLDGPAAVLERLPVFLAADLRSHAEPRPEQDIVVFFDTFEAIRAQAETETDTGSFQADEWVRELIANAPGMLFVLLGRDKIRWDRLDPDWETYLQDQHLLGELSPSDADLYLGKIPIPEPEIGKAIVTATGGHPFYLQLEADLYLDILEDGATPAPEDPGKGKREIYEKFMGYRSLEERETVKPLAVARRFDRELFGALIRHFQTGFPITAFDEFVRYSFVLTEEDGSASLHELMRDHVQSDMDAGLIEDVHGFLFEYYDARCRPASARDVTPANASALGEAVFHRLRSKPAEVVSWLNEKDSIFHEAAQWAVLRPLWVAVLPVARQRLGAEHEDVAVCLNNLAMVLDAQGRYVEAEPLYGESLGIRKAALGSDHPDVAQSLNNLAELFRTQGRYAEAEPLYRESLVILKAAVGPDHPLVASSLGNLADCYFAQGCYAEAAPLYEESLRIRRAALGSDHADVARSLRGLATLKQAQGRYAKAEPLYEEGLMIRKSHSGPDSEIVKAAERRLEELRELMRRQESQEPN